MRKPENTEQQKVTTQVVQTNEVIVIQQANPQVIYVPAYNLVVVYGPPIYPYPPIYYPPVGYYAAGVAIGFGVGVAMGAFWGGAQATARDGLRQRPHQREQPVREPLQPLQQRQPYGGSWNHNPRIAAHAARGSEHREPLWRHGTGDLMATRRATARQNSGASARTCLPPR